MAPRLTDRDATLSARRVCCPCLGHKHLLVCHRAGSPNATEAQRVARLIRQQHVFDPTQRVSDCTRIRKTRIRCRAPGHFRKALIPESRDNRNIASGQKTIRLTTSVGATPAAPASCRANPEDLNPWPKRLRTVRVRAFNPTAAGSTPDRRANI
jgi:hypothetical protein